MNIGLYQSASALSVLERWQDSVYQNITSSQTSGFRKRTINFSGVSAGELHTVTVQTPNGNQSFTLTLARFANPSGLRSLGGNLYEETAASGTPEQGKPGEQGFGRTVQGYTETSNVNIVEEMVNLIVAQRASTSTMLRCQLIGDGALVLDTTFVVRAQLWRDSWSTRQPLTVGALFDATVLEARRVDVLRERDALPASVGDRNFVFARAVPAGRMLPWRDVAKRPLVKKGELVEVAAVDGPLVVTMKGMAMESGAKGETVTVRNPESRRDFAALVISENRVQVRF